MLSCRRKNIWWKSLPSSSYSIVLSMILKILVAVKLRVTIAVRFFKIGDLAEKGVWGFKNRLMKEAIRTVIQSNRIHGAGFKISGNAVAPNKWEELRYIHDFGLKHCPAALVREIYIVYFTTASTSPSTSSSLRTPILTSAYATCAQTYFTVYRCQISLI